MSKSSFGMLIGLVIGAVWAIAGFPGAVITAVAATIGFVVGQVLEGRVDLTEYLGHRSER